MSAETGRDAGYDDWLDAVEAGEGFYVECANGHGSLPPRRACPRCGSTDLTERPLPETGTVEAHTVVHVATPDFLDDAPYTTAIAAFGPVNLTGVVRGAEPGSVENGSAVAAAVGRTETTGERVLVFEPQ